MLKILLSVGSNIYFGLKANGTHGLSNVSNIEVAPLQKTRFVVIKIDGGNEGGSLSQTVKILIGVFSALGTVITTIGSWLGCKRCQKKENDETSDRDLENKSGMLQCKERDEILLTGT